MDRRCSLLTEIKLGNLHLNVSRDSDHAMTMHGHGCDESAADIHSTRARGCSSNLPTKSLPLPPSPLAETTITTDSEQDSQRFVYQARLDSEQSSGLVTSGPVPSSTHSSSTYNHGTLLNYSREKEKSSLPQIPIDVDRDLPATPPDVPDKSPIAIAVPFPRCTYAPESSIQCSICLSFESDVSALACGHTFGTACLSECLKIERRCPLCREAVSSGDPRRLYLS